VAKALGAFAGVSLKKFIRLLTPIIMIYFPIATLLEVQDKFMIQR
jgi:hypothetical protein